MLSVKIKLPLQDEIRRFSIDASTNLEQLTAKLTQFGIHLASEQQNLAYTDDEGDEVSIRSNEELQEAIALARASTPSILHLNINKSLKKKIGATESVPEASQPESTCPFSVCSRWRKNGGRGLRHFARPKCIIGGILAAAAAFKILSLLSCVLGFWPFVILGFFGVRCFLRRRCANRRFGNGIGGCHWAQRHGVFPGGGHQFRSCGFAVSESDETFTSSSSSSSTTSPSATPSAPASPVVERASSPSTSASSAPLSESSNADNVKSKFEALLTALSEMGFTDRALNIEKLVANRLNLSATIQSLLNN